MTSIQLPKIDPAVASAGAVLLLGLLANGTFPNGKVLDIAANQGPIHQIGNEQAKTLFNEYVGSYNLRGGNIFNRIISQGYLNFAEIDDETASILTAAQGNLQGYANTTPPISGFYIAIAFTVDAPGNETDGTTFGQIFLVVRESDLVQGFFSTQSSLSVANEGIRASWGPFTPQSLRLVPVLAGAYPLGPEDVPISN